MVIPAQALHADTATVETTAVMGPAARRSRSTFPSLSRRPELDGGGGVGRRVEVIGCGVTIAAVRGGGRDWSFENPHGRSATTTTT